MTEKPRISEKSEKKVFGHFADKFYNGSVLIFFVKPVQTFLFCIANVGVLISFGTAGASEEDRRRGAP